MGSYRQESQPLFRQKMAASNRLALQLRFCTNVRDSKKDAVPVKITPVKIVPVRGTIHKADPTFASISTLRIEVPARYDFAVEAVNPGAIEYRKIGSHHHIPSQRRDASTQRLGRNVVL